MTDTATAEDLGALDETDFPDDLAQLERMLEGGKTGDTAQSQGSPSGDNGQTAQVEQPGEAAAEAPVLAADGKTVIPYAVLKSERERSRTLDQQNRELAAELERLKGARQPDDPGPQTSAQAEAMTQQSLDSLSENDLQELEESFPEIAKLARALQTKLRDVDAFTADVAKKVDPLVQRQQEAERRQREETENAVQTAIDANPTLRYLQDLAKAGQHDLWNQAADLDAWLRKSPKWADKTVDQRFTQVVKLLESENGTIELPPDYQSPGDLRQKAAEAVRKAGTFQPQRLADLEGGVPPDADAVRIESMSLTELEGLMSRMKPEEFDRLLSARG